MENLKDVLAEKLIALEKNITPLEKVEAMEEVGISRPTLDKYLNGEGEKIDTATRLIKFFTDKVNKRIEDLRESKIA